MRQARTYSSGESEALAAPELRIHLFDNLAREHHTHQNGTDVRSILRARPPATIRDTPLHTLQQRGLRSRLLAVRVGCSESPFGAILNGSNERSDGAE